MQPPVRKNRPANQSTSKPQLKQQQKLKPSQLVQKQLSGSIFEDANLAPKIIQFQNLADYSIYTTSTVPVDEPLFEPIPPIIQFTDYEPLQIKEKIFKLRNKDKVARRVKIFKPDSRLFQVVPLGANGKEFNPDKAVNSFGGTKVAPGMETNFIIRFSPEAKTDYNYDIVVETEREKFIVPIVAVGKRAMIDFPDQLDFGNCPVKYSTEKPVIIRNLGEKTTKWFLRLPNGFDSDKKEGVLEFGNNEQIVIKFFPTEAKSYKNEAVLSYDNMEAYVPITGTAHNGNVYLSKSYIQMDEAYIGLQTQQTLQIINKSNVKVNFEWRAFATEKEEQEKKNRLRLQLEEEESEERMLIKELVSNEAVHEEFELEENEDSEEEERDEKALIQKKQKKAELMLGRKYKNIRKAIEDDMLLFQDDIFSIEPVSGCIWPNSEMTITCTFVPKGALHYSTVSYCNISCSEERLALNLSGEGIGPKSFLSVQEVNLGDVFVNEIHKTEVVIENRGEIECRFELMTNERAFGKMFKFDIERGILGVGQRIPFTITFQSSIPGEFKETFRWRLEGSADQLSILFIGHVIAPTFQFDVERINFGAVSYSFQYTEKIRLTNTSTVAFTYNLRIPGDGKLSSKEFEIEAQKDTVQAKKSKEIFVTFIPKSTKQYEMVMVVDIEGVGQDMLSIPITADSQVPKVELKPSDRLDFGEIFLRHADVLGVQLINNSDLKAKFQVLPQNDEYKVLAKYTVDPESGIIDKNSSATISICLTTKKLGEITLPLSINIIGSNNGLPHVLNIVATSIGPIVEVGSKELDFKDVNVLQDYSQKITITNKSKIEADFHAFTKNKVSIFKPIQKHGVLQPSESMQIEILCCADDAIKVQDILHFVIKEGVDVDVVLKAKGVGSTMFCKEDLNFIPFGTLYTHRKITKEIFVENKGRKPQKLTWTRKLEKEKKKEDEGKSKQLAITPEEEPVFQIVPDHVTLDPKHGIMFQFRAYSTRLGKIPEIYMLQSCVGSERKSNVLYTTTIEGDFIKPTLVFSEKKLFFKYSWEKNVPFMPISRNLELTCGCSLPVNFTLKCQAPFSINQDQFSLLPGKSASVRVDFDPGYKTDRKSGEQEGKLIISHLDHPHKDIIDLIGSVNFPNITLDTQIINFGSILNDTTKKMVLTMKNVSEMKLDYEWTFIQEEVVYPPGTGGSNPHESRDSQRQQSSTTYKTTPINEIFDILPLSGSLEQGHEEQVEFVYNAFAGQKFKTQALCHVDGGPEYDVTLVGDSSLISYRMSTNMIELGDVRFCEWVSREFMIDNTGKVTFEFKVSLLQIKKKGFVEVLPLSGRIAGGEKQKLVVRVSPVIPSEFKEIILVSIGYYEPEPITVTGKGVYPSILINQPRQDNQMFQQKFDQEMTKKKIEQESQLKRTQLLLKAQQLDNKKQQQPTMRTIEQIQTEVERDIDRYVFCEMIKKVLVDREKEKLLENQPDQNLTNTLIPLQSKTIMSDTQHKASETLSQQTKENRIYDKIFLATYICDFGNVVINSVKSKIIKIHNPGSLPVDFTLDRKYYQNQGYMIQPERVSNLPPGEETTLTISYQTKKTMKFGKTKTVIPIEVKKGSKYYLELNANITIPRIKIENIEDTIDFGKVLVGQRQTFYIRLINDKEILCEWYQNMRNDMAQGEKKEEPRFIISPSSGCVQPGQKMIVEVQFTPVVERQYVQKFILNVKENTQPFILNVKGQGVSINLDFKPQTLSIGPVLPYAEFAYTILEVRNPSDYDTELISLDYDPQYTQDEEMLTQFAAFETSEFILKPVRNAGQPMWDDISKAFKRKKQKMMLMSKLQDVGTKEETKVQLQKEIDEIIISENEIKVEYPVKVESDVMLHVVIMGNPRSNKTALLQHLQGIHKRKLVNLNEIVEWNRENQTEAYQMFEQYQLAKENEIKVIEVEREKLLKKAGKKSKELEDKWGPIPVHLYQYLSEDLIKKLIQSRMSHPDCNAGVMFDNLQSEYWPSEIYLFKCLMDVVDSHQLQLVLLKDQVDQKGLEICKVIEWEGMLDLVLKEENPLELLEVESSPKNKKGQKVKKEDKKQDKGDKEKDKDKSKKKEGKSDRKDTKSDRKDGKPEKKSAGGKRMSLKVDTDTVKEIEYFQIDRPEQWKDEFERTSREEVLLKIQDLMSGRYRARIDLPKILDPVFEVEKPPPKVLKKGEKAEEPPIIVEEEFDYSYLQKGQRIITVVPLHYNLPQLFRTGLEVIPAPVYPDPDTLPVTEPIFQQLVYRTKKGQQSPDNAKKPVLQSSPRPRGGMVQTSQVLSVSQLEKASQLQTVIQNTSKYFVILTPNDPFVPEVKKVEVPVAVTIPPEIITETKIQTPVVDSRQGSNKSQVRTSIKATEPIVQIPEEVKELALEKSLSPKSTKDGKKAKSSRRKDDKKLDEDIVVVPIEPKYLYKKEDLQSGKSRWIIPKGKTLILVVKFFTKTIGTFEGRLNFENFFGLKKYSIDVKGVADYPQVSTLPKSIFWQVKKNRPLEAPASYLSKVFVQGENVFDFGPLLIGKNPIDKQNYKNINSATFRISNQGKFDADIKFALLSTIQEDGEFKKGIFQLDQESAPLTLSSVPLELRIWSFPDQSQRFRDELIVMVKDNPLPLIIPLSCFGCRPTVDILKDGDMLKFDKLLLNQDASKTIIIKNTGMIGAKWKITGLDTLPEEFTVTNTGGELTPTQEARIDVRFKALKERKVPHKLTLEVEDVENINIKQEPKLIQLDAEGFDITVELKFPDNNTDNLLDFGAVKVGDYKDQTFIVKNTGLYKVKFSFSMKKKLFKEIFKVEPTEMELDPNQNKEILVRFIATKELKLKTNNSTTDLIMEILEGKTLELFKPVPINVQFNSVFSKYSILPVKSINFGPIQFNENKTRLLEIKNEGQFEFSYTVFDFNNDDFRKSLQSQQDRERTDKVTQQQLMPSMIPPVDPKQKGAKKEIKDDKKAGGKAGKAGKNDPPPNQLKIGQWTLNPCVGTIGPDSSATVEINFAGQGQKNYEQKIAIDVTNRDPADQPSGILYEVVSESCIPGINTDNFDSIFEEQVVIQSQSSSNNIASLINSNVFFIEEKIFFFGTLVPSKVPDGIIERFKLTNPNKVPCTVKLDVRKRNPNNPNENFAFEIQPKSVKIAPHESTYIKVSFKPTIMALYFGIFEAIVENGEQSARTHKLVFDLRGEGALPTLKLERPKEWFDDRTPLLKFGRQRVGKSTTLPIVLKNDGQVPATVKWDIPATNESFKFLDSNTFTLLPKTSSTFNVEFVPREPGQKTFQLMMQTLLNPYEITKIQVAGEAFFEEIIFENLPQDLEDEVVYGDCIINLEKKIIFQVRNNGPQVIRFSWNTQGSEDFNFLPRQGHLAPNSSKQIQLYFKSMKSVTHKQLPMLCETKQIKQNTSQYQEWDDTMSTQRYVTNTEYNWIMKKRDDDETRRREEELALANTKVKGAKKQDKKVAKPVQEESKNPPASDPNEDANIPISDPIPETDHTTIEKTEKTVTLKATAVADFSKYEIESRQVYFKPTLMYTTRIHQLKLRNSSLISLSYTCKIVSAETGVIDPGYFYIFPKSGTVAPNCDEQFTIKFSPTEVEHSNERLLVVSIEHLDPNQEKLIIELDGEAERPICHFELPPNKYREKKPDLEAKYNVIEFESLGTKIKNTKRFYVVNPTSQGYEYEWKKVDDDKLPMGSTNASSSNFKCLQQKGLVLSGKKGEMIFEYNPDQVGTHESYWTFEIAAEKIVQHFLIVGTVIEPNIIFDVGKVNFGPLLVEGRNKETVILKNLEDVPIAFYFEKDSVRGDPDYADSLVVTPMSGIVKALGDLPIEIQFAPKVEREYNYNLVCNIKRRSRPVTLNVKGIGYVLHHTVWLQQQLVTNTQPTAIDFGDIYINEKKVRTLTIDNQGDFNFDFSIRKHTQLSFIQIVPENGTVKKNEKFSIEVRFQPIAPYKLNQGHNQIHLSVVSGPTYTFILNGTSKKPGVDFSFQQFDFGPCFVLKQPLPITKVLEMRNRDISAMAIETNFEKKPFFDVQLASGQVILPMQIETTKDKKGLIQTKEMNVLKIPITFTPRECTKYEENVLFDINGLHKIEVRFTGEGVQLKLELDKSEDQNIDFGVYTIGQVGTRSVFLVNQSQKAINISFDMEMQLQDMKQKNFIKVRPKKEILINPRERKEIILIFKPSQRLHGFKKELYYKIVDNNEVRKLLTIAGACHGVELKLMEDTAGFGAVVINSKLTRSVQLANLGDVGAKFSWDTTLCKNYFTISPQQGTVPAHEDMYFEITFHPNVIDNDIRFNKVKCNILNSEPLYLNLLGKCIDQPKDLMQELKFETVVRTPQSKKVTIKNPTTKPWKVKATVNTLLPQFKDYFEGKDYAEVAPNSQTEYEIVYKPLTMTTNAQATSIKDEQHEGTLFFPLPDGQAILYNLSGKSLPPLPQNIDLSLKAKKNHIQILPVKNWLKSTQRFSISWTLEPDDPSIILNGANTFDVSGEGTKEYKFTIYGLRQAQNKTTIYFKNTQTNEFIFYKIVINFFKNIQKNLTILPPDPLQKIEMTSMVREVVTKLVTIENPLNVPVDIKKEQLVSDSDSISFNPPAFSIPARSEFGFEVVFRPLLALEQNTKVLLKSAELGDFLYPLKLQGLNVNTMRTLYFKAPLGTDMSLPYKFFNYTKKLTTYQCVVTKLGANGKPVAVVIDPKAKGAPVAQTDFLNEVAQVQAQGVDGVEGLEVSVGVKFEPSSLFESRAVLILQSPEGGEYQCLLVGQGQPPQPKGPFKLAGPKPPTIDFKNPFFEAQEFTIRIDNPAFTTSVKSPIKIDGKKLLNIAVVYKAIPGGSNNGRLSIQSGDLPQWVFYIQGE